MDPAGAVIYENTSNRLQTLLSDGTQRSVLSGQGQHICQSVSSLTGWTFYHTTPAATGMQIFCNALVASLPFLLCLLGLAVLVYLFFKRQVIITLPDNIEISEPEIVDVEEPVAQEVPEVQESEIVEEITGEDILEELSEESEIEEITEEIEDVETLEE